MISKIIYISIFITIIGIINIILKRKIYIIIILSIELIIIGISFYLLLYSIIIDNFSGFIFTINILIIGATESVIGLSLIMLYFKYLNY